MKTYFLIFLRICLLLIPLCLSSDKARGLSLDNILRAGGAAGLQRLLQTEKRRSFLRALCAKRHLPGGKKSSPLAACYQLLSLPGAARAPSQTPGAEDFAPFQEAPRLSELDTLCLSLKVSDFDADLLRRSLQTKEISLICRRRLEEKLKILEYRELDKLVPELKGRGGRGDQPDPGAASEFDLPAGAAAPDPSPPRPKQL